MSSNESERGIRGLLEAAARLGGQGGQHQAVWFWLTTAPHELWQNCPEFNPAVTVPPLGLAEWRSLRGSGDPHRASANLFATALGRSGPNSRIIASPRVRTAPLQLMFS